MAKGKAGGFFQGFKTQGSKENLFTAAALAALGQQFLGKDSPIASFALGSAQEGLQQLNLQRQREQQIAQAKTQGLLPGAQGGQQGPGAVPPGQHPLVPHGTFLQGQGALLPAPQGNAPVQGGPLDAQTLFPPQGQGVFPQGQGALLPAPQQQATLQQQNPMLQSLAQQPAPGAAPAGGSILNGPTGAGPAALPPPSPLAPPGPQASLATQLPALSPSPNNGTGFASFMGPFQQQPLGGGRFAGFRSNFPNGASQTPLLGLAPGATIRAAQEASRQVGGLVQAEVANRRTKSLAEENKAVIKSREDIAAARNQLERDLQDERNQLEKDIQADRTTALASAAKAEQAEKEAELKRDRAKAAQARVSSLRQDFNKALSLYTALDSAENAAGRQQLLNIHNILQEDPQLAGNFEGASVASQIEQLLMSDPDNPVDFGHVSVVMLEDGTMVKVSDKDVGRLVEGGAQLVSDNAGVGLTPRGGTTPLGPAPQEPTPQPAAPQPASPQETTPAEAPAPAEASITETQSGFLPLEDVEEPESLVGLIGALGINAFRGTLNSAKATVREQKANLKEAAAAVDLFNVNPFNPEHGRLFRDKLQRLFPQQPRLIQDKIKSIEARGRAEAARIKRMHKKNLIKVQDTLVRSVNSLDTDLQNEATAVRIQHSHKDISDAEYVDTLRRITREQLRRELQKSEQKIIADVDILTKGL